jgi:tRNA(Glu) U13 pseudouridine synthase TruD
MLRITIMRLKSTPEDFIVKELLTLTPKEGSYRAYLLHKRCWNTEDCLQWIAQSLRVQRKDIGYCGNKDRHAVTEQYITIRNGPKEIRTPQGFTLTYVCDRKEPLRLGDHERNFFIITVRELQGNNKPELKPVKNYFGEQRFGSNNTEIGFALLRKQYKQAADLLGLQHTTDPIGVLRTIPKHTLLLYVHAVQSQLWNEIVLQLPAEEGEVPMPGYAPEGDTKYFPIMEQVLQQHNLNRMDFINKSFPELSLDGGSRSLLQDVQDFSATDVADGACTVQFSLGKGSYATETVKQLFTE